MQFFDPVGVDIPGRCVAGRDMKCPTSIGNSLIPNLLCYLVKDSLDFSTLRNHLRLRYKRLLDLHIQYLFCLLYFRLLRKYSWCIGQCTIINFE